MSASVRFLGIALVGWVGLRVASLGLIPGAEALTLIPGFTPAPQIAAYQPPPPEPPLDLAPTSDPITAPAIAVGPLVLAALPSSPMIDRSAPRPRRASAFASLAPEPAPLWFAPIPQLDEWPLSRIASSSRQGRRSPAASVTPGAALASARFDRLSLTTWALLRQVRRGTPIGPTGLAPGGTLGGSQTGARLTYAYNRSLAGSLRTTSAIGGVRGAEVALGVRYTPFGSIPVSFTAERRQRIGRSGRSAFALFAEGGVYDRPMPFSLRLNAYAQAGVVGARRRDLFADGALTLTRPLFGRVSAGVGVWGGVQPHLSRVDAGPRISMALGRSMRVDLDYRQRLVGNALPGSGPALTLAGDF